MTTDKAPENIDQPELLDKPESIDQPEPIDEPARRISTGTLFFLGTLVVLALGFIGLELAGNRQQAGTPVEVEDRTLPDPDKLSPEIVAQFGEALTVAPSKARAAALEQIEPLLDEAFRGVYDRISAYADFHYSIKGEYTELVFAAAGTLQADLDAKLFVGLPDRLTDVATKLDDLFATTYAEELHNDVEVAMASVDLGSAIGLATQNAVKNAQVSVAAVGGAASTALVSKVIAKKVSAKVATKVAAKGLAKSGSALTGAGAGAVLCSPSGPIAAVCGVIGAGVAWVVVDAVVISLDELMNREEFETDLRTAIDAERARIAKALHGQLAEKERQLLRMVPLQTEDLTLAQLSEGIRLDACRTATLLHENFGRIRTEIATRSPENLGQFRADLALAEGKAGIRQMVDAMRTALEAGAEQIVVDMVTLEGNFRSEARVNRSISVMLAFDGHDAQTTYVRATKEDGFRVEVPLEASFNPAHALTVSAAIEQHRRLINTFYGGKVTLSDPMGSIAHSQGLTGRISTRLPVIYDDNAFDLAEVQTDLTGANALMNLHIDISAGQLDEVPLPDACADVEIAGIIE